MPKTTKRAFIYTRISQDRDGATTSTDRQERDCRALAKREGLRVVRVFGFVAGSADVFVLESDFAGAWLE